MINAGNESKGNVMDQQAFEQLQQETIFIQNWLTDLLEGIENQLDREQQIRLFEACGKGCFKRFAFKGALAQQGKGSLEKLIDAYRQYFEIWRADDGIHIRYGETSAGCYCPAARFRPTKAGDLHCECTRMTHQTILETALAKPVQVEIIESVRRNGKTCHFLVHYD
jgi:hypothetical protein